MLLSVALVSHFGNNDDIIDAIVVTVELDFFPRQTLRAPFVNTIDSGDSRIVFHETLCSKT